MSVSIQMFACMHVCMYVYFSPLEGESGRRAGKEQSREGKGKRRRGERRNRRKEGKVSLARMRAVDTEARARAAPHTANQGQLPRKTVSTSSKCDIGSNKSYMY